jgi:hypothetical protein
VVPVADAVVLDVRIANLAERSLVVRVRTDHLVASRVQVVSSPAWPVARLEAIAAVIAAAPTNGSIAFADPGGLARHLIESARGPANVALGLVRETLLIRRWTRVRDWLVSPTEVGRIVRPRPAIGRRSR